MRKLYRIKGKLLTIQFHIIVIITLAIVCCIYVIERFIKLVSRQKTTRPTPSFEYIAFCIAVAIPKVSPANRRNILIGPFDMN